MICKCSHNFEEHNIITTRLSDHYYSYICDVNMCRCGDFKEDNLCYLERRLKEKEVADLK